MKIKDIRAVAVDIAPAQRTKARVPKLPTDGFISARWRGIPNTKNRPGIPSGRARPVSSRRKTAHGGWG